MRRHYFPILLTSLIGFSALVACSSEGEVDEVESAHKAGEPVLVNDPHVWLESEYSPVAAEVARRGKGGATLGETDPLSVRMQLWMDRMHGAVRDMVTEKGAPLAAPRPIIKVLDNDIVANAWVMRVNACTGIEIQGTTSAPFGFDGGTGGTIDAGGTGTAAPIPLSLLGLSSLSQETNCVDPRVAWNKNAFVSYWNGLGGSCGLRVAGDKVTTTDNCAPTSTTKLVAGSTSNYIHFTTRLIQKLDEVAMATVLAHELGHYYRGHVLESTRAHARFWYEDGGQEKPVESMRARDLEARYAALEEREKSLSPSTFTLKGKYSPRLRNLLVHNIGKLLKTIPGKFACSIARDTLGPWAESVINRYPSIEAQRAYLRYESEVYACASSLKFSLEGLGIAPGQSSGSGIDSTSPEAMRSAYFSLLQSEAKNVYGLVSPPSTFGEFLYGADQFARRQEAEEEEFLSLLRENKIGLYTTEQEADDISLELMSRLGYSSAEILEAWIRIGHTFDGEIRVAGSGAWEAYIHRNKYDVKQCEGLVRQDFKNFGRPVFVPIGDLGGDHHGNCYRIFNIYRETRKHLYKPGPKQPLPGPAWSELISKL